MNGSDAGAKRVLEALLFAADEPLSARRLAAIVEEITPGEVADLVRELNADYLREGRAFHVQEIAGGYRLVPRSEFAGWIAGLRAAGGSPRRQRLVGGEQERFQDLLRFGARSGHAADPAA